MRVAKKIYISYFTLVSYRITRHCSFCRFTEEKKTGKMREIIIILN
jgi:hypothetical protein